MKHTYYTQKQSGRKAEQQQRQDAGVAVQKPCLTQRLQHKKNASGAGSVVPSQPQSRYSRGSGAR